MKWTWQLAKEAIEKWWADDVPQLAAAVAFYTVFSFAPALMIVIAVASMVYGRETARDELLSLLRILAGSTGTRVIGSLLEQTKESSFLVTALGMATSLFGATAAFVALQKALNRIWEVAVRPGYQIRMFLEKRLLSFALLVGTGLLLLGSLLASAALATAKRFLNESLPLPSSLLEIVQFGLSFLVITALFATLYKVLPDAKIAWSDVGLGAAATSLLFTAGKTFLGNYLVRSAIGSAYGAAGSLVLLLVWIYYSVQIFFLGAEFSHLYARRRGNPIEPLPHAVRFRKTYNTETLP